MSAALLSPQVRGFWAALLFELRNALASDVFALRQQLGKTLGLALSFLGR